MSNRKLTQAQAWDSVPFEYIDNGDGTFSIASQTSGDTNVLIADGADATMGAKSDLATTDPTATATLISLIKGLLKRANKGIPSAPVNVALTTSQTTLIAANTARKVVTIQNISTVDMYIGTTTGVTSSNGIKILPDAAWEDRDTTSAWYGLVGTGTGNARVQETTET